MLFVHKDNFQNEYCATACRGLLREMAYKKDTEIVQIPPLAQHFPYFEVNQ